MNTIARQQVPLALGSLFGLTALLFGAFGAHYLNTVFNSTQMTVYNTATLYQMFHALVLCIIGFYVLQHENKYLIYSSLFFIIGILGFSFSLYLYLITNITLIAVFTPIGGFFLFLGWICLFLFSITYKKE